MTREAAQAIFKAGWNAREQAQAVVDTRRREILFERAWESYADGKLFDAGELHPPEDIVDCPWCARSLAPLHGKLPAHVTSSAGYVCPGFGRTLTAAQDEADLAFIRHAATGE
jgi:hypothetical protein